jgi:HTH domain
MTEDRLETFVPGFSGFQAPHWQDLIASSEMHCATLLAHSYDGELDVGDLHDILVHTSTFAEHCCGLADRFSLRFDEAMASILGFELGLRFADLEIPADHGFGIGRILATMPTSSAVRLLGLSEKERHIRLEKAFASQPGPFERACPSYGNERRPWMPVETWDADGLCALLDAFADPAVDGRLFSGIATPIRTNEDYQSATRHRWRLSARELADRCEVNVRTVYRDIEELLQTGLPIEGEPGSDGGYRLIPGATVPESIFEEESSFKAHILRFSGDTASSAGESPSWTENPDWANLLTSGPRALHSCRTSGGKWLKPATFECRLPELRPRVRRRVRSGFCQGRPERFR